MSIPWPLVLWTLNPVHALALDRHAQGVQCVGLDSPGSEPVREAEEVFLVDRIEHGDDCTLDDLVLQRGIARGASPVRLRDEPYPYGQRPVRAGMDPCVQLLEAILQTRLIVLPWQAIHARCGTTLERRARLSQRIDGYVVQQRRDRLYPTPSVG